MTLWTLWRPMTLYDAIGTRFLSFFIVKLPGRVIDHSFPSSTQVKNECNCFPHMPSDREQGQLYLYYASSCLLVLSRVVCYGKTIFLTECRLLRDPHGFLFGISFLRISENLPSPKDFHVAFGQNDQIKWPSLRSDSRPGFSTLHITFGIEGQCSEHQGVKLRIHLRPIQRLRKRGI